MIEIQNLYEVFIEHYVHNFSEALELHSNLSINILRDNLEVFSHLLVFSSTLDGYRIISLTHLHKGFATSHCLTQDGLGKDSRFPSIYLYFLADMLLKLMKLYVFLRKKKRPFTFDQIYVRPFFTH